MTLQWRHNRLISAWCNKNNISHNNFDVITVITSVTTSSFSIASSIALALLGDLLLLLLLLKYVAIHVKLSIYLPVYQILSTKSIPKWLFDRSYTTGLVNLSTALTNTIVIISSADTFKCTPKSVQNEKRWHFKVREALYQHSQNPWNFSVYLQKHNTRIKKRKWTRHKWSPTYCHKNRKKKNDPIYKLIFMYSHLWLQSNTKQNKTSQVSCDGVPSVHRSLCNNNSL